MPDKHRYPRIGNLDTMSGVRIEVAKMYRQARRGDLPIEDATRLVSILRVLAELIIAESVEDRLGQLERGGRTFGMKALQELKQAA